MSILSIIKPRTLAQQMSLLLTFSLTLLFSAFFIFDVMQQGSLEDTAKGSEQLSRINALLPLVRILSDAQLGEFENSYSRCHEGYRITPRPLTFSDTPVPELVTDISRYLQLAQDHIQVHKAIFSQSDFSYGKCGQSMAFPMQGLVISVQVAPNRWLNAEVHGHEWHLRESHSWLLWAAAAFAVIVVLSVVLISHLTRPLSSLSHASRQFARGLRFSEVKVQGSPDLQDTIESFNAMQREVLAAIKNRTTTLAAISHDIRTPLTALKLKIELLEDEEAKNSLLASVDKMERITASGLAFLRGQHAEEEFKNVNLTSLLESECDDFNELGMKINLEASENVSLLCRPVALARAIRNLLENANKYAESATLALKTDEEQVVVELRDTGPGIPTEELKNVLDPFKRLSEARESDKGGFGLGLAIVKAIVEGHNGLFTLENATSPTGVIARISLPKL